MGCIRIDDNVFVGANSTILANVHIGSDIIIGAGSLVNKDLEGGYVYAGVPVRKICKFEDFVEKRKRLVNYPKGFKRNGDSVNEVFADYIWKSFYKTRLY